MKKFNRIPLLLIIAIGLLLSTQPAQAGFFDWFSWSKIKSIISSKETGSPASVSEQLNQPEESSVKTETTSVQLEDKDVDRSQREEKTEKEPTITIKEIIKEVPVEKIIYRDSPQQNMIIEEMEKTIDNLNGIIASLESRIKSLESYAKMLEDKLKPVQTLTEEEKYLIDYNNKVSQLENLKVKYLGFGLNYDGVATLNKIQETISYKVSFLVDTIIPVEIASLNIAGGGSSTYYKGNVNNKVEHYYGNELIFDLKVANSNSLDTNPTITISFYNKNINMYETYFKKTFFEEKVVLPAIPKFNTLDEFYDWYTIKEKEDSRLNKCEEYRGKEFQNLDSCIRNL